MFSNLAARFSHRPPNHEEIPWNTARSAARA
jgi:hypothetical protein